MNSLKIAKYQLQDVLRSRWILVYGIFFLLMTDALFRFGGSGERVILSLMNVVLIAVPLVAVVLGTMYLYSSREFTELLLSQPVRRRSLFGGLFVGLAVPLSLAFALGVGLPFWAHGGMAESGWAPILMLLGTGTGLTLIFASLAFVVALATEDRIKGLGFSLGIWVFFTVVFNGLVLLAIYTLGDYPMEKPVIALSLLNPVDLGRILLLLNFDISALMGFTGSVFKQFFGSGVGQAVTIGALAAWLAAPLALGMRSFSRKNF